MVERLARLLASWEGMYHLEIDGLIEHSFDWKARRILEAMREPPLAVMTVAGRHIGEDRVWRPIWEWRLMIDAALVDD